MSIVLGYPLNGLSVHAIVLVIFVYRYMSIVLGYPLNKLSVHAI